MKRLSLPLRIALLPALLAMAGVAWAGNKPHSAGRAADKPRSELPDSVRRVELETGGEVLRAEPMQRDGREVYRLKVLTADGRVRVVQDDPSDHPVERERQANRRGKEKPPSADVDAAPPQY